MMKKDPESSWFFLGVAEDKDIESFFLNDSRNKKKKKKDSQVFLLQTR